MKLKFNYNIYMGCVSNKKNIKVNTQIYLDKITLGTNISNQYFSPDLTMFQKRHFIIIMIFKI